MHALMHSCIHTLIHSYSTLRIIGNATMLRGASLGTQALDTSGDGRVEINEFRRGVLLTRGTRKRCTRLDEALLAFDCGVLTSRDEQHLYSLCA